MRFQWPSIPHRLRLPSICALCNQYNPNHQAVCSACHQLFVPLGPTCQHCAEPLPDGDFLICGLCCKKTPPLHQVIAAYAFEEPLRTLLHDFKYHEGLYLCSFLSHLIKETIPPEARHTQCLIPVPIHPKRLRQRGYNQAALLAKQLARHFQLPYDLFRCKKIINTAPQASLNASQRQKNLHRAFEVDPIPYQHVTLIDDLITTGSTANALAFELKKQGVQRVDLWCCAKACLQP